MRICTNCDSELPGNSRFCGQCGQRFVSLEEPSTGNSITRSSGILGFDNQRTLADGNITFISANNEEKTFISSPHKTPNAPNTPIPDGREDEDMEHEILHSFDGWDEEHAITAPLANAAGIKKDDAEEEEKEDILLPFPFMPNNAPPPSPGNILAQGPLHIDQVPFGGQPHIPGPAQPTPMAPPATPHPVQLFQAAPSRLSAVVSPSRSYNPLKPHHAPSQQHNPLKHHRQHHNSLKHHPMRPPCLVVVVVAFIGICILAIIFFTHLAKPLPHLTPIAKLVGVPIPGQKMILHGGNFEPGETVTAVIDKQPTASNPSFLSNAMQMGGLLLQKTTTPAGIKGIVDGDGSFSLTITVDPSWPIGSVHTVYVYKQDGTIIKLPPFTVINPTTPTQVGLQNCLDETGTIKLGPVTEGSASLISKTIALCTQATNPVKWTAQSNQKWLQLPASGQIQAPGGNLSIKASAKGLKAGAYSTTLLFNSSQNTTPVTLSVVFVVIKAPPSSTPPNTPPPAVTCVGVTPQVISFTNVANQVTLLSKNVSINNCGSGGKWSASISGSSSKPWLSVGPAQGPIPSGWFQGVAITVSSAALSAGSYSDKVTFHIGSSSADLTVLFTVNPQKTLVACIDANPKVLAFSGIAGQNDVQATTLKLSNCGAAGQWSLSTQTDNGMDWLQASLHSHTLKVGDAQEITITVSSAYLSGGVHYAQLIVYLGSSTARVLVSFDVRDTCFKVDYRSLLFKLHVGDSPVQDTLNITNCSDQGMGPETWYGSASTVDGANWLTLDRTSSRLATKSSQHVAVDVSIANMRAGIYIGNVLFIMGSHRITVRVKLIIMETSNEENCIKTDTTSLDFFSYQFSNPDSQEVDVENCAKSTEDWTVTSNAPDWLHADPVKGTLNVNDDKDVRVRVTSERLDAGDRTGILTFRSGSKSVNVSIHLRIAPLPCITVNGSARTSLTFNSSIDENGQASRPSSQMVKVKNCGGAGSLSTSITTNDGTSWLGVNSPTDHLDGNQEIDVPFAVDSSGLAAGSYSATIPFTITVKGGAQSSAYVQVSFIIAPPPVPCKANPSTLNFVSEWGQDTPSAQNVTLSGCGPNATWTETDGSNRLFYVYPDSGTFDSNNGGSQVVRIEPDRHPSETGIYSSVLTFTSSSGKTATVTATWTINAPSNATCIQPDSAPLSFSDQDQITAGDVSFSNCGAYPGTITVSADSSWLTISSGGSTTIDGTSTFATGSGPTVAANADSTNLTPGSHNGTIKATITTVQGSKSASINVVYIVPLPVVPPTPTPIVVPTDTPTDTAGITPSDTSGVTPTDTPGITPSNTTGSTPTDTPGITPTDTTGSTPTDTPAVTPTATPCIIIPTATPGLTPTPIPCYTPTDTPGVTPTDTPGVTPTDTPVITPTDTPGVTPTDTPIPTPTDTPVPVPTDTPTPVPTDTPTPVPTDTPTPVPTDTPTPTPPPAPPTDTPTPGP